MLIFHYYKVYVQYSTMACRKGKSPIDKASNRIVLITQICHFTNDSENLTARKKNSVALMSHLESFLAYGNLGSALKIDGKLKIQ